MTSITSSPATRPSPRWSSKLSSSTPPTKISTTTRPSRRVTASFRRTRRWRRKRRTSGSKRVVTAVRLFPFLPSRTASKLTSLDSLEQTPPRAALPSSRWSPLGSPPLSTSTSCTAPAVGATSSSSSGWRCRSSAGTSGTPRHRTSRLAMSSSSRLSLCVVLPFVAVSSCF